MTFLNLDKDGRELDTIKSRRSTGSGALSPTDTFNQTDWQNWTSIQYDKQHRKIGMRVYFSIPAYGKGKAGRHYAQILFGYDALERRNRDVAPGGTIIRTVWATPQRVQSVWVGTNDNGATDADPTGGGAAGNNMVKVTDSEYDGGSGKLNGVISRKTGHGRNSWLNRAAIIDVHAPGPAVGRLRGSFSIKPGCVGSARRRSL